MTVEEQTKVEIEKNNGLIAKFMGAKFIHYSVHKGHSERKWINDDKLASMMHPHYWRCSFEPDSEFTWYFPKGLEYHENWEWLMPVALKLKNEHGITMEVRDIFEMWAEIVYHIKKIEKSL